MSDKSVCAVIDIVFRRFVFLLLVAATIAGLLILAGLTLSAGSFGPGKISLLCLFALTTPWLAVGFWNATIGLLVMRGARDPSGLLIPEAARSLDRPAITASTAIVMCVRNEAPPRVVHNLETMMAELVATGAAGCFHVYVLSDTDQAALAVAEEQAFGDLAARWKDRLPLTYRRREVNTGFKAGNIGDFLERWGDRHELMITLDADSFMTAPGILRMVGIMQRAPRLGIMQSLAIGMPTTSAFARLFQFGMRVGLRSWTVGSAWWQADCGPYWGHNAVLRVAPFKRHCAIPPLPGSGVLRGHILSHDQIEAALMRRAGYEVRVLPEEDLGWEENPPTLIEFLRRELRWLQGTLQYVHFIGLPGLRPVSRVQLLFAMLMFTGSPAWVGLWLLGTVLLALEPSVRSFIDPYYGRLLLSAVLVAWYAPKIATAIDILTRPGLRRGFGGVRRFVASTAAETVFYLLLAPIMWISHTLFFLGLPFGRVIGWGGQVRDDHAIPWSLAWRQFRLQTGIGAATLAIVALTHIEALPLVFAFWAGGPLLSVPLCVLTSSPVIGRLLQRLGIGRLPEETDPPDVLSRRGLALADADAGAG